MHPDQMDRDADLAGSDIDALTAAMATLAKCLTKLEAISAMAYRANPSGQACDAIGEVTGQFDDLRAILCIAHSKATERENEALCTMEPIR